MYGFWRLGFRPAPSAGAVCVANGVATATSRNEKKSADRPEHRDDPHDDVARTAPVEQNRRRRVAGQDEQPEEQRPLLPAPEGRDRVPGRQLAARVLRDVDEREVVPHERGEQDERGDGGRREGADQRVLRGQGQPAAARVRSPGAGHDRVEDEPERGGERGAAELRHLRVFAGVYLDGHFVTSVPGTATNVPLLMRPSTWTSRPARKRSGTEPS